MKLLDPATELRIAALERQYASLQRQQSRTEQLLDVRASWPWKRVWFVVWEGWHPYRLDVKLWRGLRRLMGGD
jgi:hypothetical protein